MHASRSRAALVAAILVVAASGGGLGAACANGGSPTAVTGDDASTAEGGGTGQDAPSGSSGGGCDADLATDWTNCGACGHECPTGQICNASQCQQDCQKPQVVCPGVPGCFDTTSDLNNCGACGAACLPPSGGAAVAIPQCVASQCIFSCPADAGVADGGGPIVQCEADSGGNPGCFDLTSTSDHCGACNKQCPSGQICTASNCCPSGNAYCSGACKDVTSDPNNCGACDAGCPAPAQCSAGKCTGYTVSNPTGATFVDACALKQNAPLLVNSGGGWASNGSLLALPFSFTFFGTAETQFWVQNTGTLGLGKPQTIFPPDNFPDCKGGGDPTTGYAAIVAFGDANLATGANGVCYATTGTAPSRQFAVTWSQATEQSDPGSVLTFSIVLSETTNTIDLMYETASGADGGIDPTTAGTQATFGMQLQQGTSPVYTALSCHTAYIQQTPFFVRLTPVQ